MIRAALFLVYSLLLALPFRIVRLAARWNPKLARQFGDRPTAAALAANVAQPRAAFRRAVLFFVSSAGEYEQAKPLMDRLVARRDTYLHVLFFSRSGLEYAKARGETVPYALVPATDSVFDWGHFLTALRPDVVCVVRYELWPGFLESARHFAKLYLIDASRGVGEASSRVKRWARRSMLRTFDGIFAVSEADAAFFRSEYDIAPERVLVAGDTKYDRARERALAKRPEVEALRAKLDAMAPGRRRLVVGSAHPPDLACLLGALAASPAWDKTWQIVVAPHHIGRDNVEAMTSLCRAQGLDPVCWSQAPASGSLVFLDTMGMLAEAYGAGEAAFVGGALHHKVHNVLEPAAHGLALAFGPHHQTSAEAVDLVAQKAATVVDTSTAFATWWHSQESQSPAASRDDRIARVTGLAGAADRILATWQTTLDGQDVR